MPTCLDIITRALRKLAYIGRNESPSQADEEMGLVALQSLYDGWATGGMLGRLCDVYKNAAYTARPGERVRTLYPVTLPTFTDDGATGSDDYGFKGCRNEIPANRALIVVVNPSTGLYVTHLWEIWRGQWVSIQGLKANDEAPLSVLGADGLACCLAEALADDAGQKAGDQTRKAATSFRMRLAMRLDGRATPAHMEFS